MATLLRGAEVVSALNESIKADVRALVSRGVLPTLAILRVGEKPDDLAYERGAVKRAETVGIGIKQIALPETVSQEELIDEIAKINADEAIHGCLMLRPLPKDIDDLCAREALLPEKDIDGITDGSLAGVFAGTKRGFPPCTAQACMEILDYYKIDPAGKSAVVIGRSLVIGKPVAMMLLQKHATVTICHTRTKDMPSVTRRAEILIVAAGKPGVVGAEYVSAGQTVLDVGINFNEEGKMTGDADFAAVEPIVDAITPVPGGVGTVTTSVLMAHVVEAAKRAINRA
ncbi:MAG: tetrahydrofolate dehydrogenase/cyclohydrolase catalytic domain-containing protein [Eubacteriales bacterium]|jgi:methylenetetrahydrofolate dehydrogenase (NADP+)/methenyltetrahydrofolate cyclohydrolase|nr:tetrahydrofolate dehydrogenase/cyclohydrolase catalytic domain-containing protein [Eubacteriales bacterium]